MEVAGPLGTPHDGDSAPSCCAFTHWVAFEEVSGQGYWSELPFPSPGDLLDTGMEPGSPALQTDALLSESPGKLVAMWAELVH